MLKTSKDPGPATVAADCAATGVCNPSGCSLSCILHDVFPSFVVVDVVVVIMIAATIFDQHVLPTRESFVPTMVS